MYLYRMKETKNILLVFLDLNFGISFAQVKKSNTDSLKAAKEARSKDYAFSYKATVIDSAVITAVFLDMNYGLSCSASPNAGMGIFKIIESSKKMKSDTI